MYGVNSRRRNHHCLVQPLSTRKHIGCTTPKSSSENPGNKSSVTIHASLIITTSYQNLFVTYLPSLGYMSLLSQSNHSLYLDLTTIYMIKQKQKSKINQNLKLTLNQAKEIKDTLFGFGTIFMKNMIYSKTTCRKSRNK